MCSSSEEDHAFVQMTATDLDCKCFDIWPTTLHILLASACNMASSFAM